jgi:hypothetical protein
MVAGKQKETDMIRLRQMGMMVIAVAALCALQGCQNNVAGKPGYTPTRCAAPGSSCDLESGKID